MTALAGMATELLWRNALAVIPLALLVAVEPTRYAINGILLEVEQEEARLVTTDGRLSDGGETITAALSAPAQSASGSLSPERRRSRRHRCHHRP